MRRTSPRVPRSRRRRGRSAYFQTLCHPEESRLRRDNEGSRCAEGRRVVAGPPGAPRDGDLCGVRKRRGAPGAPGSLAALCAARDDRVFGAPPDNDTIPSPASSRDEGSRCAEGRWAARLTGAGTRRDGGRPPRRPQHGRGRAPRRRSGSSPVALCTGPSLRRASRTRAAAVRRRAPGSDRRWRGASSSARSARLPSRPTP